MPSARYRALVEYDGTNYYGFQRQRQEFRSIQGELEKAISRLSGQLVSVTGSGRTDRGVHAFGQVISFTIEWRHNEVDLGRAINANLSGDIVVRDVRTTSSSFHPRFDARRRVYRYYVYNTPVPSPVRRLYSWHVREPLDIDLMNEAAMLLVGEHDFLTFGLPPQGESTIRQVFEAHWRLRNEYLAFTIVANAFLYRMVRSLVSSMVDVGKQRWRVADFDAAFKARDRGRSAAAAPPHGLYLESVTY